MTTGLQRLSPLSLNECTELRCTHRLTCTCSHVLPSLCSIYPSHIFSGYSVLNCVTVELEDWTAPLCVCVCERGQGLYLEWLMACFSQELRGVWLTLIMLFFLWFFCPPSSHSLLIPATLPRCSAFSLLWFHRSSPYCLSVHCRVWVKHTTHDVLISLK